MTEVWEEFKFRAAVGAELAKKDVTGDGFVRLAELGKIAPTPADNPGPADLGALLAFLGLREKYGELASEFKLEHLEAMARKDSTCCFHALDKAGVSPGDCMAILAALCDER